MNTSNQRDTVRAVLALNGGSSSIKFALYAIGTTLHRRLHGKIDRSGSGSATLTYTGADGREQASRELDGTERTSTAQFLIEWLDKEINLNSVHAVGHRLVQGMRHYRPELITPELLQDLHRITPFDPEHLPAEIELIELLRGRYPSVAQVACFDTAFHHEMPWVAKLLPIPRRYQTSGVQRYGFHGLSYAYLRQELERLGDGAATNGRVILAHLGNGASMAAMRDGHSIDTSMGFTPTSGLPMSTRSGDLDPGLVGYLARSENMTAAQFQKMVNSESGLLGVSDISSDMRVLLAQEETDARAADAVALFCYQAKKYIGSFAAALGGLDTLVFAGGMGESSPVIRERICNGLEFLGINVDAMRNAANDALISAEASRVLVRVIRTDEECMIAHDVCRVLALSGDSEKSAQPN